MQTGTGQVLDGSSRGLSTASKPADRAQANQGAGKVPKPILASLCDILARQRGKALSRMASRQNRVRDQACLSRKQKLQDFIVYSYGSFTKDQSGWGFTVKQGATTIHEDCSLYGLSLKFDNGGGSSHPCPLLDGLKR